MIDYTHFILPPPSALLFVPLSYLSYRQAFWVWIFFLSFCVWGVACVSARLLRAVIGYSTRWEGALVLLIAISPVSARAIRVANVSPVMALLIGITLLAQIRGRCLHGAVAMAVGAMVKYANLILAPLLVMMRRWRTLFLLAAVATVFSILTLAMSGISPFIEFYEVILPTLSRPSAYRGNQSLAGLLARVYGRPLPEDVSLALDGGRILSLGAILSLLFRVRQECWLNPACILAAAGLLLGWLYVFSPIAWEHWPLFLCPLWGWLFWEMRKPGVRRFVSLLSLGLMYFPAGLFHVKGFAAFSIVILEPFNSWQLMGVMLLMMLAVFRLHSAQQRFLYPSGYRFESAPIEARMRRTARGAPRSRGTRRPG